MVFRKKKSKNLKIKDDNKCPVNEHADNIDDRPDRVSVAKDLKKIRVNMLSSADKVDGQGVGSAYLELISTTPSGI